jgi:DNA-binding transcriptional MerR regulator
MSEKSELLVNELVSACIAFGREREPEDVETRIEKAQRELREYIAELEAHIAALEEAYARKLKSGTTFPIFQSRRR